MLIKFSKNFYFICCNNKIIWKQKLLFMYLNNSITPRLYFYLYTVLWAERFGLVASLKKFK